MNDEAHGALCRMARMMIQQDTISSSTVVVDQLVEQGVLLSCIYLVCICFMGDCSLESPICVPYTHFTLICPAVYKILVGFIRLHSKLIVSKTGTAAVVQQQ